MENVLKITTKNHPSLEKKRKTKEFTITKQEFPKKLKVSTNRNCVRRN